MSAPWAMPTLSREIGLRRAKRAKRFAAELGWPVGILTKQRTRTSVEIRSLAGDPRGRSVVLFDDEIATGGTLVAAAEAVLAAGARQVHAVATHGVFTPGALELLERSPLERILVCDTVPRAHSSAKLEVVSIAADLASLLRGKPSA